jgi:hypothetical protein
VPARDGLIGWSRPAPVRDQEEPAEENGELVCRIVEDRNGGLHIIDAGRLRLRARRAKDGTLEIRHEAEEGATGDEADPDIVGTNPGTGGDPALATGRTGDALAAWHRSGRSEFHMGGLAELQRRLDAHYATR